MSTSFLVIQAQRDLAIARDNELRSYLDYQLAAVNFDRVQRVGFAPPSRAGALGDVRPIAPMAVDTTSRVYRA